MKKIFIAASILISVSSCRDVAGWFGTNKDSSEYAAKIDVLERDQSINASNAYSDLFLDSAAINNFIQQENLDGARAQVLKNFYAIRNEQYAWFNSEGLTEPARGFWSLYASKWGSEKGLDESFKTNMDSLVSNVNAMPDDIGPGTYAGTTSSTAQINRKKPGTASISGANSSSSANLHTNNNSSATAHTSSTTSDQTVAANTQTQTFVMSDSVRQKLELQLTQALIEYASGDTGIINTSNLYYTVPRKKMDPMAYVDSLLHKKDSAFADNQLYNQLKQQLAVYYEAAKNGGWKPITSVNGFNKGARSAQVLALKERLRATNDYTGTDTTALYSDSLASVVKSVQQRFGLQPTGVVNDSLITALNVPAEKRVEQILVNMNRAIWMPPIESNMWVEVNIPSQMLFAYDDSAKALEMPVIVGEQGTNTVAFTGNINQVVFNPDWNVPRSIVENEIMPAMKNNKNYLESRNMEIVDDNGGVPEIRQKPGKNNALGQVKFLFPNRYDIYLHDTPDKSLFQKKDRRISHGCIRVANAQALADFILGDSNWSNDKVASAIQSNEQQTANVKDPVPVRISYLTAWVDEQGRINFRDDIYGHDNDAIASMFTTNNNSNYAGGNLQPGTRSQTTTP